MKLTDLLLQEADAMYAATEGLIGLVEPGDLSWKPATGRNWMTVGQVVRHSTDACGSGIKGFVTGDWGLPEGVTMGDIAPEDMFPPAETLPAVGSREEALALLAKDREVAHRYIAEAGEENLLTKRLAAPWGGPELTLFQHLLHMVAHLGQHKGQLYYYLKLLGRDVNTGHLWGA